MSSTTDTERQVTIRSVEVTACGAVAVTTACSDGSGVCGVSGGVAGGDVNFAARRSDPAERDNEQQHEDQHRSEEDHFRCRRTSFTAVCASVHGVSGRNCSTGLAASPWTWRFSPGTIEWTVPSTATRANWLSRVDGDGDVIDERGCGSQP